MNLGTPGCAAVQKLRNSPDFQAFRDALRELASASLNRAVEGSSAERVDATAYARAVRDLYVAIEAELQGTKQYQVVKPGAERR